MGPKGPFFMAFKIRQKDIDRPRVAKWYTLYINSEKWAHKREKLFAKRGKKCEACGGVKWLTVHHLTYLHVTEERDRELKILCIDCHAVIRHSDIEYIERIYDETYIDVKKVVWMKDIRYRDVLDKHES